MDHDIRFPYAIGVSAGACNGLSYASRQRGRAKYSNIDLLEKYNYIGLKYLLKKRNILASPVMQLVVTITKRSGEAKYVS